MATRGRLQAFLRDAFTADDLRRLVKGYDAGGADAVAWGAALERVVDDVIDALDRRRGLGPEFFKLLAEARPRRVAEIDELAAAWTSRDAAAPAPCGLVVVVQDGVTWPAVNFSVRNSTRGPVQLTEIRAWKVASQGLAGAARQLTAARVAVTVDLSRTRAGAWCPVFGEREVANLDAGQAEAFRAVFAVENAAVLVDLELRWIGADEAYEYVHWPDHVFAVHAPAGDEPGAIQPLRRQVALDALLAGRAPELWPGRAYQDRGAQALLLRSAGRLAVPKVDGAFQALRTALEATPGWPPVLASFAEVLSSGLAAPGVRSYLEALVRDPERLDELGALREEWLAVTIGSALLAVQERPIAWAFAVLDATLTVDLGEPDDTDAEDDDDAGMDGRIVLRSALAEFLVRRGDEPCVEWLAILAVLLDPGGCDDLCAAQLHTPEDARLPEPLLRRLDDGEEDAIDGLRAWLVAVHSGAGDRVWRRQMPRLARCADLMLGREVPDAIAGLAGDPMLQLAAARSPNLGGALAEQLARSPFAAVRRALARDPRRVGVGP